MTVETGTRLGPYEITAKLGEGGMGEVWRATDTRLKREVAIKVLPAALAADGERLARLEREAQLLAQLQHPHIASIYGLEESGGALALVMELVEGPTLEDRLTHGALPVEEAIAVARQIAEALEAAHEKGIVHRDLKPANVKLAADGTVKVLDFGLAKAMDATAGAAASSPADLARSPTLLARSPTLTGAAGTQLGVILGTAPYMAPEQARGGLVDRRADVWAFGVILHEMLTGRRLFAGETVSDILAAVLRADVDLAALPAGTPPELLRLVRRCLERNPRARLRDIGDARVVLDELASGRVDEATAAAAAASTARRPRLALLVAAAAGALLLALGAFWLGRRAPGATSAAATSRAPMPMSFQQVTDTPGVEWFPSLSPDGKDVVFARIVEGRSQLFLQRVGARIATALTPPGGNEDREPAYSPDGNQIAFRSDRDGGGVFLMDTSGESVRRLTDYGFFPTWSPDGKEIAVAAGESQWPTDRAGIVRGLYGVDVASGAKRVISEGGDVMQPRWSPHGQRIAFWGLRGNSGQRDIFTVAADGSEAKSAGKDVTNDPPLDWNPVWSADGRWIYFASLRGGTMNLWRIAIDEASGTTHGEPEPVMLPALWVGGLAFSQDGKRLAFGALDWRSTLYRADLDLQHARVGPPVPLLKGTQPMRDHAVSPDGQWIAFNRTTPQEDLFVSRIDGSELRRLTDDPFRDRSPVWSPDGKRLVFYSDRGGSYRAWIIRADGSGLVAVTPGKLTGTPNFPAFSPDGTRISLSILPGGGRLIDMAGDAPGAVHDLPSPGEGMMFWPFAWSRDGKQLSGILVLDSGVVETAAVLDLASGTYERLPDEARNGQFRGVCFLSDGRRMLARDRAGIWLLDAAHREWTRLVSVGGYMTGRSFGVSPDDRWITWSETATEGDVWVAEMK